MAGIFVNSLIYAFVSMVLGFILTRVYGNKFKPEGCEDFDKYYLLEFNFFVVGLTVYYLTQIVNTFLELYSNFE